MVLILPFECLCIQVLQADFLSCFFNPILSFIKMDVSCYSLTHNFLQ